MATFYVVATPIGNLEDITLRAIRVLKEVDLILCEDTRVTGKLLGKYEIGTKMMSYHTQSKLSKIDHIIEMLEESKDIALVSDAGTPTISDRLFDIGTYWRRLFVFRISTTQERQRNSIQRNIRIKQNNDFL
jgi:16S rRNA (cytidine1402-2'-O)-methyltransferase